MSKKIYIILSLALLLTSSSVFSQKKPENISFQFAAFRQDNRVILRWVLDNAEQWRYANSKGYKIERAEGINGTSFITLNSQPIKPLRIADLRGYDTASYVFRALAVLHSSLEERKKMLRTEDDLYTLYFLTSCYQTEAAVLSASAFVDSTIKQGVAYTYRISVIDSNLRQQPGTCSTIAANSPLPEAPVLKGTFGSRSVTLEWDMRKVSEEYFAVAIEGGTEAEHLQQSGLPVLRLNQKKEKQEDNYAMSQIVQQPPRTRYYYRIKGLNIFGVYGKPGNIIDGTTVPDLDVPPTIKNVEAAAKNRMLISWSFPDTLKISVSKFEIWASAKFDSNYTKIGDARTEDSSIAVKVIDGPAAYIIVKAVNTQNGQAISSIPFFYQPVDSLPPAPPTGVDGSIDSLGKVTIKWRSNTEADLQGYKVFRSQSKNSEFVPATTSPGDSTTFIDHVAINQLNKEIYYYVIAVDKRYNESAPSAILELKRPDKIPPAAPAIEKIYYLKNALRVKWKYSVSKDVINYEIYRRNDTGMVKVGSVNDSVFADDDVKESTSYAYSVRAIDDAGNKSNFSLPVSAFVPKSTEMKDAVKNLNSYVSQQYKYIELNWQVSNNNVEKLMLYKIVNSESPYLLVTMPASKNKYVDEDVAKGRKYVYIIRVLFKDGTLSKPKRLEVNY